MHLQNSTASYDMNIENNEVFSETEIMEKLWLVQRLEHFSH